jgi:hypothetical protein
VHVTFGDRTGNIDGSYTSSQGAIVDLVASGCGFDHYPLTPAVSGSSLAAPLVATATWLRHLLDDVPASEMRAVLARSGSLVTPRSERVLSGGLFDPAQLVANPSLHYVDAVRNVLVPLRSAEILTDCGLYRTSDPARAVQDMRVYATDAGFQLIRRETTAEHPYTRVHSPCALATLRATLTPIVGSPLVIDSPAQFANEIAFISF